MNDDRIIIKGIPPYDGEYPITFDVLSMEELHTIKRISGVRAGEIREAIKAGDSDLVVAFAVIAMERAGKTVDEDVLWKSKGGAIDVAVAKRPKDGEQSPPEVRPQTTESPVSGGRSSRAVSAIHPEKDPSATGTRPLDTSAISGQVISAV